MNTLVSYKYKSPYPDLNLPVGPYTSYDLLASEDGSTQSFIKDTKDYMTPLMKSIDDFYKYYENLNKDKIKQTK